MFQIKRVVLYSRAGERRVVPFKLGSLNIISGASDTGKTALIDIVEYCLGGGDCNIPKGVIRDCCSWYAVVLTVGDFDFFIARPDPGPDRNTSTRIHLAEGTDIPDVDFEQLRGNSDVEQLNELLTRSAGIGENLFTPPEGQKRPPLEATIRHALKFCFQSQGEVANRYYLFHRQEDNWVALALRDAFPYFLGVTPSERISLEKTLRRIRFELRQLEAEAADDKQLNLLETSVQKELIAEALDVGLLTQQEAQTDVISALKTAMLSQDSLGGPDSDLMTGVQTLQNERQELRERYRSKRSEIDLLRSFLHDGDAFTKVLTVEEGRLHAAELLAADDPADSACPLCGTALLNPPETIEQLLRDLDGIRSQIVGMVGHDSKLHKMLFSKEEELDRLRLQLRSNIQALEALSNQSDSFLERQSEYFNASRVKGRISFYLERHAANEVSQRADSKRESLKLGIDSIVEQLAAMDDPELAAQIDTSISAAMSEYAKNIRFEWKATELRLDTKKLTVAAHTKDGVIYMKEMGSAENHLACHLIAHLALHRSFIKNGRPIPRFLFLDQPSQVYYPPEQDAHGGATGHLKDEDSQGVHGIFSLFYRFCREFADDFQLIVIDHADLGDEPFQDALLERWREGAKLIPLSWYESE